ncbi:hypothetical protein J3R85_000560 [Psidium guajava]|nr:hypothetical protein J3R85_000560 [Psidium guajava]
MAGVKELARARSGLGRALLARARARSLRFEQGSSLRSLGRARARGGLVDLDGIDVGDVIKHWRAVVLDSDGVVEVVLIGKGDAEEEHFVEDLLPGNLALVLGL